LLTFLYLSHMSCALITGASKGIGKAIAYELAAKNTDLLLVARSTDLLQQTANELSAKYNIRVEYFGVDLSKENAAALVIQWIDTLNCKPNILVNNAGYGLSGNFENYTAAQHSEMLHTNIITLVQLTALLLPQLKTHPQAYIMNIASSAAYQSVPYLTAYAASKAFVVSFSRGLSYELKNTNVSVTCISPGGTDTDFANRAQVSEKAIKAGQKLNMSAEAVAAIAVKNMYEKKKEVVVGFINKLGAFLAWLAPKTVTEKIAADLYK